MRNSVTLGAAGFSMMCLIVSSVVSAEQGLPQLAQQGAMDSIQQLQIHGKQKQGFEARSKSIEALLNAYRNIAAQGVPADQAKLIEEKVTGEINQARSYFQIGNYSEGNHALNRAYSTVRAAIIALRDGATLTKNRGAEERYGFRPTQPRQLRDSDRLNQSIDALLAAYKRVSEEKGFTEQALVMDRSISALRDSAGSHYQSGEHGVGYQRLVDAYTLIKEALASLRDGDTLVQALSFANRQQEFLYYVRKTHSQKLAIQILLSVNDDVSTINQLNDLLTVSQTMMEEADALAANNHYDAAVAVMDKVFTRLQSGLMMVASSAR